MLDESLQKTLTAAGFLSCLYGGWLLLSTTNSYALFRRLIEIAFSAPETQWIVVLCLVGDFVILIILESRFISTYNRNFSTSYERGRFGFGREYVFSANLWLSVLVLLALLHYRLAYSRTLFPPQEMAFLLTGIVFGKGAKFFFKSGKWSAKKNTELRIFLVVLILLLVFSSGGLNFFYGRWMGLLDNPNDFGMLMGVGVTLAIGLRVGRENEELRMRKLLPVDLPAASVDGQNWHRFFPFSFLRGSAKSTDENTIRDPWNLSIQIILFIAAGLMGIGLLFSYSRGAWLGTAIGLLYLAKAHGKFKWRWVLPGVLVMAMVVMMSWHSTADTGSWYLKRLDLSRPSAQHRIAAWKAGFKIMRDHPFGVGWNKAIETYEGCYSPPRNGGAAIATNDYLMLGMQLGLPALICFVTYVALCFRKSGIQNSELGIKAACRAGAIVLLIGFWFDGGLFKLPTAATFWILLELGSVGSAPPKAAAPALA